MTRNQTKYIATPKHIKFNPETPYEPDGIEIFGTGSTAPRDFVKHPTYLSKKEYVKYFLHADRFSFWAAVLAVCMIFALLGAQACRTPDAYAETTVSMDENQDGKTDALDLLLTQKQIVEIKEHVLSEPVYETRTFKVTAYCICPKCCGKTDGIGYGGAKVVPGISCAADLAVLPLGSVVEIDGIGVRTVQDKGSKVIGDHVDILMSDHQTALNFGVQYREVRIIKNGN